MTVCLYILLVRVQNSARVPWGTAGLQGPSAPCTQIYSESEMLGSSAVGFASPNVCSHHGNLVAHNSPEHSYSVPLRSWRRCRVLMLNLP